VRERLVRSTTPVGGCRSVLALGDAGRQALPLPILTTTGRIEADARTKRWMAQQRPVSCKASAPVGCGRSHGRQAAGGPFHGDRG